MWRLEAVDIVPDAAIHASAFRRDRYKLLGNLVGRGCPGLHHGMHWGKHKTHSHLHAVCWRVLAKAKTQPSGYAGVTEL